MGASARFAARRALHGAVGGAAVLALAGSTIAPHRAAAAGNSPSASTQLSLQAAPDVLSVTVSPSSGSFGFCRGGDSTSPSELGFPNGTCGVRGLVITNTGLPGHMMVNGSPMLPVGGGTPWVLCGSSDGSAARCTNAGQPGADQYNEASRNIAANVGVKMSGQPQCDTAFATSGSCAAAPGQSATENLTVTGPQSTGNGASSYTTTVTWTVTP